MNTHMKKHADKYAFVAPTSLREAQERVRVLKIGILNTEKQLGDKRQKKVGREDEYENWRERTKSARIFIVAEKLFVEDWIFERRLDLLLRKADVYPKDSHEAMLQRVVIEGRKMLKGEENVLPEVLDVIHLHLTHVA